MSPRGVSSCIASGGGKVHVQAGSRTPSRTYAGASQGPWPDPGGSSRRREGSRDETTVAVSGRVIGRSGCSSGAFRELTKSMTPLMSGHLKPRVLQGPAVHQLGCWHGFEMIFEVAASQAAAHLPRLGSK